MAAEIPQSTTEYKAPAADPETFYERLQRLVPEMASGSAKGATVDLLGLPVDLINEALGAVGLKSSKPFGGSDSIRSSLGIKPTSEDTPAEIGGSLISPGGVAKAMIVGAIRKLPQTVKTAKEASQLLTDLDKLTTREEMVDFFKKHDLFTGVEGKAKSYVSDVTANLDKNKFGKSIDEGGNINTVLKSPSDLTEIIDHPELFKLYPELKDVRVVHNPTAPVNTAQYVPTDKKIIVGPQSSDKQMKSTILHETQHAIQGLEDFSFGTTARMQAKSPGYYDEGLIKKLKDRREAGDKKASEMLDIINQERIAASARYRAVPGEAEARFTESTMELGPEGLKRRIESVLREPKSFSFWDK